MSIEIAWEVEARPVSDEQLRSAVEAALEYGAEPGREVSLALVSDETLAELHGRFLDDPSTTDVMSFLLDDDEDETGAWGEVVVSVDRAREVAAERGLGFEREVVLYVVHGTLHLCGFDDHEDEDRAEMRVAEAAVLGKLGYPSE
ncbi:MAG: putative rRNA maturation factor [Planctomycetota bacterium]